ncbi:hypothetical protein HZH66_002604 [Vespula vulgaris]|uniref:Uncharacterized protein n=1 Tax=Vespula vulgaris TaxID=7454 RepID=A0A834KK92_VESVU|nr:hypothetical protein HZH66_002604 [Vespula vulgaris]
MKSDNTMNRKADTNDINTSLTSFLKKDVPFKREKTQEKVFTYLVNLLRKELLLLYPVFRQFVMTMDTSNYAILSEIEI